MGAQRRKTNEKSSAHPLKPARGQVLLSYRNRFRGVEMPLFKAECVEQVRAAERQGRPDNDLGRNLLLQGDCLSACAYMKDQGIAADLVYIDPPFASGANYARKLYLRGRQLGGSEASIGEELMYGDTWQKEDYLNWLYERLLAIRQIMREAAGIYVHLDWHIGHYVKVMMDEVFGEDNFINEIIWAYRSGGASRGRAMARKHDVIYLYAKDARNFKITAMKERQYLEKPFMGGQQDEQGRFYVDTILTDTLRGVIRRAMPDGSIIEYNTRPVLNLSKERTGYNTQKPEDLLKLLLEIASAENLTVADFFSGSGTTAVAAHRLNRRFIACDIGVNAIQTARDRLREAGAEFDLLKILDGIRRFRNPQQAREQVFALLPGYRPRSELGLGEFWDGGLVADTGVCTPVVFPGIKRKVTRRLVGAALEEVRAFADKSGKEEVAVIVYVAKSDNVDQDYADRASRRARRTDARVRLLSLDELLREKAGRRCAQDRAEVTIAETEAGCRVTVHRFFSPYLQSKLDERNARRARRGLGEQGEPLRISDNGLELIEAVQFDTSPPCQNGVWRSDQELEDKPAPRNKVQGVYQLRTDRFRLKIRSIAGDELILNSDELCRE